MEVLFKVALDTNNSKCKSLVAEQLRSLISNYKPYNTDIGSDPDIHYLQVIQEII